MRRIMPLRLIVAPSALGKKSLSPILRRCPRLLHFALSALFQFISFTQAKAHFNIAKSYDVAIFDLPRFAVSDTATIYVSTICRTGVGDEESSLGVHSQCRMDFGNAGIV